MDPVILLIAFKSMKAQLVCISGSAASVTVIKLSVVIRVQCYISGVLFQDKLALQINSLDWARAHLPT